MSEQPAIAIGIDVGGGPGVPYQPGPVPSTAVTRSPSSS